MSNQRIRAIRLSVQKWADITYRGGEDHRAVNCECCKEWNTGSCIGCPIMEFVGVRGCGDTPYDNWCIGDRRKVTNAHSKKLAFNELIFLHKIYIHEVMADALVLIGKKNLYYRILAVQKTRKRKGQGNE